LTFPPEENQDRGPDRYVMDIYIPIACDFLPPKKINSTLSGVLMVGLHRSERYDKMEITIKQWFKGRERVG